VNTELIFLTDRSGSMNTIIDDAVGGINALIVEQKKVAGACRVTFAIFDDHYEVPIKATPLESFPVLNRTYCMPRGSTALLDAIGRTLTIEGARIADEKWAEKVIVVIATDGYENMSREYTKAKIKEMVGHCEKHGWSFVYLAANQDAFGEGSTFGVGNNMTQGFVADSVGTRNAYAGASATIGSLRGGK